MVKWLNMSGDVQKLSCLGCAWLHPSVRLLFIQLSQSLEALPTAWLQRQGAPLAVMPLSGVGAKALSHTSGGVHVLLSISCRELWVWLSSHMWSHLSPSWGHLQME